MLENENNPNRINDANVDAPLYVVNHAQSMVDLINEGQWSVFGDVITNDSEIDPNMTLENAGLPAGTTLLQYAASNGMPRSTLLRLLNRMYSGYNFETVNEAFWEIGAVENNWPVVRVLLDHYNPDVDLKPGVGVNAGISVLFMAIRRREWHIAKILVERGADLEQSLQRVIFPNIIRAIMAQPVEVLDRLFSRLENIDECPISTEYILEPVNLVVRNADGRLEIERQRFDNSSIQRILRHTVGNFRSPFTRRPVTNVRLDRLYGLEIEQRIMELSLNIREELDTALRRASGATSPSITAMSPVRQGNSQRRECPGAPEFKHSRKRLRQTIS